MEEEKKQSFKKMTSEFKALIKSSLEELASFKEIHKTQEITIITLQQTIL